MSMTFLKRTIRRFKKDNKGSALIVCIIILLFVSILSTIILYMAGVNYRMKKAELNTKISFYTGEEPLERMQSNLIVPLSEAMNEAYALTNAHYADLGSVESRRRYFYLTFYEKLEDIMIKNYCGSGTSLGSSGELIDNSTLIKNMMHNLTYSNETMTNGIPIADIYVNDGSIITASSEYDSNPIKFINMLSSMGYFDGNTDGSPRAYLCITDSFSTSSAKTNYENFVKLSVTADESGDPETDALADADKCRLVFKNVCVVIVQNGYMSVITTDIAMQFPPIDWGGGSSVSGFANYDIYQLIYYINWKRN